MKKLLFITLTLFPFFAMSQGMFNNGAKITISTGTIVYIDGGTDGDYTNGTNGAINNDGTIKIEGDWTNSDASGTNYVFTSLNTAGTVEFLGTTAQNINGNITKFEDLTINNSLAGSAITLSVNADVTDQLALTNGIVATGGNTLIMSNTATAKLSGGTSTEFVNGNFRRYFVAGGGNYIFPVGDGTATTNYKRADLISNNLTLSGTDYLTVSVAAVNELTGQANEKDAIFEAAGKTCVSTALKTIHEGAQWTIVPSSAVSGGTTYGVKLWFANAGGSSIVDNKFTVVKRATASTSYADFDPITCAQGTTLPANGALGRTLAGGYAQKTGLTSFSKFAIASATDVLPIELIAFTAFCDNGVAEISWETASEINVSHFELYRSSDNEDYYLLTSLAAAGFSNTPQIYNFKDASLLEGNYYKLVEIDFDGQVIEVGDVQYLRKCGESITTSTTIYSGKDKNIIIEMNAVTNENFQLQLVDVAGKLIYSTTLNGQEGFNQYTIAPTDIASGIYLINLVGDKNTVVTQKLYFQ